MITLDNYYVETIKAIVYVIRDNLIDLFDIENFINNNLYKVFIGAYIDKNNAIN